MNIFSPVATLSLNFYHSILFLCCAEPNPAAPADDRPNSGPEPAADGSPTSPLPAELRPNQRHLRSYRGRYWREFTTRTGPGPPQQETSNRALWGLLRHWGSPDRLPGEFRSSTPVGMLPASILGSSATMKLSYGPTLVPWVTCSVIKMNTLTQSKCPFPVHTDCLRPNQGELTKNINYNVLAFIWNSKLNSMEMNL